MANEHKKTQKKFRKPLKQLPAISEKIISVLIIAFAFLFPHYAGFPFFSYTIIILLIVWLFLKFIVKQNFKDIFFSFKKFELKAIWSGALVAIILFGVLQFAAMPLLKKLFPHEVIDMHDFDFIKGNTLNYIFILIIALIVGGFYEELIFHGFIFTRLEKFFSHKYLLLSFILTNIIFGAYHFQQGILGMINAFLAGCAYNAFVLKNNRNLWYGISLHAFYDFIGLTFIYAVHQ